MSLKHPHHHFFLLFQYIISGRQAGWKEKNFSIKNNTNISDQCDPCDQTIFDENIIDIIYQNEDRNHEKSEVESMSHRSYRAHIEDNDN